MFKTDLTRHMMSCKKKAVQKDTKDLTIQSLSDQNRDLRQQLFEKSKQLDDKDCIIKECISIIKELKPSSEVIHKIEYRSRPTIREQYPGKNYIYILTTPSHTEKRTYIFGKTVNLTNRLSTYNKSEEHTVVYYKECKNDLVMNSAETAVFSKLDAHRAMKNRERFILPEDKTIEYFTKTVDDCISFFS
jgi:hypothetical protein